MDKERIKEKCAEIAKALNEGKTPQKIAEIFGAVDQGVYDTSCDCEYDDYVVDFEIADGIGFGVTFWRMFNDSEWHWTNDDEIWLWETEDYANWKSL